MEIISVRVGSPSQAPNVNVENPSQVNVTLKDVNIQTGGTAKNAVLYDPQDLTDAQKQQARENINAAEKNEIPTNTSDLTNDSGFITKAVNDLANYYLKSETYSKAELDNKISAIPKFNIEVVTSLPTTGISDTTVYLVKSGDDSSNLYTEYIYANGKWEILGSQTIDLSGYALKSEIPTKLSELESDDGHQTIDASDRDRINQVADLPRAVKVGDATYYPNHGIVELNTVIESDGLGGEPPCRALALKHGDATYTVPVLEEWEIKPFNLPLATEDTRGAMSAEDKLKLNGIAEGAEKNLVTSIATGGAGGSGWRTDIKTADGTMFYLPSLVNGAIYPSVLPLATDKNKGVVSSAQKKKLDALPDSMNSYITEDELTAKGFAKQSEVDSLSEEIADLSLGMGVDGRLYLLNGGVAQGNGIELPSGATGDVIGNIGEGNVLLLSGDIPDGTYSAVYETNDGRTINIGNFVLDTNVYYSITNNLTNCTNGNSANRIVEDESYSATITADDGYELSSVTVTMGGVDISSSAVSGGTIDIANVTGNIIITAVAEEVQAAEPVTVDIALTDGIRIGSDGTDRTAAGFCATPHIDLTNIPKPCTINLTKAAWCHTATNANGQIRVYAKKANGTQLVSDTTRTDVGGNYFTVVDNNGNGNDVTVTVTSADVDYIRFSGWWAASGASDSDYSFAAANTKATLTYTPVA